LNFPPLSAPPNKLPKSGHRFTKSKESQEG